ncbi:AraC family transcriptional regulator [Elizabethkingia miricola]|uniref:AraC family transcriptional regulator n=1 Tax=Elizabethkingia miricola TaxID=172045 RepID=A0ABD4DNX6_ELIMR|nr:MULTISPECIES: AraC family transcriptional regulator [Elizabethkingia]KUY20457.1 AraC family transcriptional regulator [Elizabethkingia miricola]MCL1653359.1 AraC family transcriptional regulator [Elizabethkingia miricola]OPC70283.1 AraC family transcriptional regulator [Elizabethkingia miricola]OPC74211.1 AraC family transcriptional regulator [Elizabethkingia miricola]QCO45301.1 helix-turn-helix transcriptional regulator [Elizabethkingia sp. 2-6]
MEGQKDIVFDKLVYSCAFEKYTGQEEFIPEHFLGFQLSGETHAQHARGNTIVPEGSVVLVRKNQLIRSTKYPSKEGKYEFLSITLDKEVLQQYALEHKIVTEGHSESMPELFFEPNNFLKYYFLSLIPYIDQDINIDSNLANLKIREAIELLLQSNPDFRHLLFDFSQPYKIDLEEFMNLNYKFNVSTESFARLTGRSLSGFKRDFEKVFNSPPQQWLRNKRLDEAYYLIKHQKQKPADIYLDLGFENLSHFYFTFKQKFGKTTSEI